MKFAVLLSLCVMASVASCAQSFPRPDGIVLPDGVEYYGPVSSPNSPYGRAQWSVFYLVNIWATNNTVLASEICDGNVSVAYPTTRYVGLGAFIADVAFTSSLFTNISCYIPVEGFVIERDDNTDERIYRISVEIQWRSKRTSTGFEESVPDVWTLRVKLVGSDTYILGFKEWLDGRVSRLQALNVLQVQRSQAELYPWPDRIPGREACAARVTHTCPDAPCLPTEHCTNIPSRRRFVANAPVAAASRYE